MNIEILKQDKHGLEISLDNATVAEVLRVYLQEQGAEFAAWRREHPSKPVLLKVESSDGSAAKLVSSAISAIKKDTRKLASVVKK